MALIYKTDALPSELTQMAKGGSVLLLPYSSP